MSASDCYDLIIIGGGIVGSATARDAALRGLKVLLLEKEDFGSGASTKTSKLVHGGLRYLETFDFALVRESLRERTALFRNAEGFVFPLRFALPLFSNATKPAWMIKLGLTLYDLFSFDKSLPAHKSVPKSVFAALYPFLKSEILKGGFHYYDGTMRDERLLIENMLSAREFGACCLNYTTITEFLFEEGKVVGVQYNGKKVYAKAILNATGSSSDIVRAQSGDRELSVTRSKGVHLVLKNQLSQDAILLQSQVDQRVFFLIPWEGVTLLGTTDTELPSQAEACVMEEDIDYLLTSANFYLKEPLKKADIASTFVGVRPLIRTDTSSTYAATRSVKITTSENGLMNVIGGKYTTFRSIAEEVVDNVIARHFKERGLSACTTKITPFSSSKAVKKKEALMAPFIASGLHVPLVTRLKEMWATRAYFCLEEILTHPKGKELICAHLPFTVGELVYSIKNEGVLFAEDFQFRRTSSGFTGICTDACKARITEIIEETIHAH